MAGKLFLAVVCVCLLAACGHQPPGPAVSPHTARPSTAAAATTPAVTAAGCGIYCQQAGRSAGSHLPGYPCPAAGCRRCPPQNCVTLESGAATVTNGVATVKLKCNLSIACHGAFLLCWSWSFCENPPGASGDSGRLAGSDFLVPPRAVRDIGVALTTFGKVAVSQKGGAGATVVVDLLDYGNVLDSSESTTSFSLTSTDPPRFPVGATASCGNFVFVGPDTSCPFAKNTDKAFKRARNSPSATFRGNAWNATVRAFSPVTGHTYKMHCVGASPIICRGGTNALVEFYVLP